MRRPSRIIQPETAGRVRIGPQEETMSAAASMTFGDRAKLWGVAIRAFAFPASIVPVLVGSAYAAWAMSTGAAAGHFGWLRFVLALVAGMLVHVGCNLINDYYDFKYGVDREGSFGGSGVLTGGTMQPAEVLTGAYVALGLGALLGLVLVALLGPTSPGGLSLLIVGIIGVLGAIWYTTGKGSAKYNALGSPLVFLLMGPGYVLGAYLVQTGTLNWDAVWVSLPVGFIVAAILHANDTRDIVDDRAAGIKTIATVLGKDGARSYYSFLIFAPYVCVVAYAALKLAHVAAIAPVSCVLPLLTFPLAWPLHKLFQTVRDEKSDLLMPSVENTAKLHMAFGVLYTIGILLGLWLTF
jgi:1,4-dihydroxy-2-naphthoate octaprenyltransferase